MKHIKTIALPIILTMAISTSFAATFDCTMKNKKNNTTKHLKNIDATSDDKAYSVIMNKYPRTNENRKDITYKCKEK